MAQIMASARQRGIVEGFRRLLKLRLKIPILRGFRDPVHTARGVAVGMFWAMTPTIGIQMMLVFATWLASRKLCNWNFSLPNGLAWTWTTNVITAWPVFYMFYITGKLMTGELGDIQGYDAFNSQAKSTLVDQGFWDKIVNWTHTLFSDFGVPILVGSVPWAIGGALVSYHLTLVFLQRYRQAQDARARTRDNA